jgi:hypothetical protein
VTLTDRIVAALSGLGQAAADYSVSELIDGSAIVRLKNSHDLAATQETLQQAELMVEQQDPASLRVWSPKGTGVEPLEAPMSEEGDSLTDGVSPDAGQPHGREETPWAQRR